ncbi:hypothetical protein QUB80_11295 [Chlorogloeopsis sp. ULAP01]|uniref:Asr1405/Asl0597 family protein n=1 Tax=Chlorogloeopsis sp. ULAP01 TaxID=3056483 RepID=UPI0025AA7217|nr:Asr1405/Asl0597 family protein [Chlorogloeopsis sp. ULAP01]MDM9381289.1 hypothetical protein [Chlorogloeopsis sp. ULAP01]
MLQHSSSNALGDHILQIPLSDRWRIYHRLQELMIPCSCPPDGSLRVQVNSCLTVILVHSTVKQFVASRQELIDWLEQCWQL